MTGILKDMQVKVGSWFGILDLRVVKTDDCDMVMRLDFLVLSEAMSMMDQGILLILAYGKTVTMSMHRKSHLGYHLRISTMILYEKDRNVKHEEVTWEEFGILTQEMMEKKLGKFVTQSMRKKKDKGG